MTHHEPNDAQRLNPEMKPNLYKMLANVADFLLMVEQKYKAVAKVLQTDQGGEFIGNAFADICGHEIEHIFSQPHAHAHEEMHH